MRGFLLLTLVLLFIVLLHTAKGYYDTEDIDLFYKMPYRRAPTKKVSATLKNAIKPITKPNPKKTNLKASTTKSTKKTPSTKKPPTTPKTPPTTPKKPPTTPKKPPTTSKKPPTTPKKPPTAPEKPKPPITPKKPTTPKPHQYIAVYPKLDNYQVEAKKTTETAYPYVARVIHSRTRDTPHVCTAILVEKAIFVTAARCILSLKVEFTTVKLLNSRYPVKAFALPSKPTRQYHEDIGLIVVDDSKAPKDAIWKNSIPIQINKEKRTDKEFKWFSKYLERKKGVYKVLGYAAKKVEYLIWKKQLFSRDLKTGETIFHEIAREENLDYLTSILQHLPRIDKNILKIRDYNGKTCLHLAAQLQNTSLAKSFIELFMKLGADINQRDGCSGYPILHHTIWSRKYELAEWLTQCQGIDLNFRTYGKLTAYQLAYKNNDHKMMQILARQGACCEEPESSDSCYCDSSDDE